LYFNDQISNFVALKESLGRVAFAFGGQYAARVFETPALIGGKK
jgi:hypothetical protein